MPIIKAGVLFCIFQWKKNQKDPPSNFWDRKMTLKVRIVFDLQFYNKWKAKTIFITVFKLHWPCWLTTKLSCLQKNQSGQTKLAYILLTILWKGCRMNVKVNVSDSNFSPSIANFSKSASCKATLCNISVKFATLFVFANATIQVVLAAFGTWQ